MKNLDLLPLSPEVKKRLDEFARQYARMAHIVIEIVSFSEGRLIVRAEQKDLVNGQFLSKKELHERVREMFKGEIPEDWKLTVSAVNFDRKDIDGITVEWVRKRMEKLGLKAKHLSNYTGIDKCTVSSILSGDKDLTKWHKVALYYFFKYYEVAQFDQMRQYSINSVHHIHGELKEELDRFNHALQDISQKIGSLRLSY
mgnify:FL=1